MEESKISMAELKEQTLWALDHLIKIYRANAGKEFGINELIEEFEKSGKEMPAQLLSHMVRKLLKDGYVRSSASGRLIDDDTNSTIITLEGIIFEGYQQQNNHLTREYEYHKRIERRLLWATWGAAIAAGLVIAWDMIKFFVYDCK